MSSWAREMQLRRLGPQPHSTSRSPSVEAQKVPCELTETARAHAKWVIATTLAALASSTEGAARSAATVTGASRTSREGGDDA